MRDVNLLGTPKVTSADGEVPRFRSLRTIALLGYLLAERRTITRERLAALFWPDDPPQKAKANLRRELHNLNQVLPDSWDMDRVKVRFEPSAETIVDLDLIRQHEKAKDWLAAAELIRGDFLEGITVDHNLEFETWLLGEQERWRQRAETILTRVIDRHIQRADHAAALDAARKLLQLTPWNEAVHRQVILLLARTGQRGAALRQYALCREILLEELGVEPSAETTALYEQIKRSQTFALHNVPAPTTPLIGRERELARLEEWLDDPDVRLITILGAGGMGKTRLSLALAQDEAQAWDNPAGGRVRFPDGIYFVGLASARDTTQMVTEIARTMHFSVQGTDNRPPQEQLLEYLRNKQMLFILDNLEHLLDEVALVAEVLKAAPRIQVVATSRARLQLQGEQVLTLDGLEYGDVGIASAGRLFLESARRIQPNFHLGEEDAACLGRICLLVDGMPLALILAASWTGTLSLEVIAQEIERGIDFLQSQARDMPARHRSIQAVFDSAWLRLAADERTVYARLSVFVGGFTREAAEAVGGASLQLLNRLVNQSLLQYDRQEDRYQLHELLRQYAAERLAERAELKLATYRAHLVYFCDLAERHNRATRGQSGMLWRRRLNQEHGNFLAAIDWGRQHDFTTTVRLASALFMHWFAQGRQREAEQIYAPLLARQFELPDRLRARLLTAYAQMIWVLGKLEKMEELATESLQLFKSVGDEEGIAVAYRQLAWAASYLHFDTRKMQSLSERSLDHARQLPDSWYASAALQVLGTSLTRQANYAAAEKALLEALDLSERRGDRVTSLYHRISLAENAEWQGHLDEAEVLFLHILDEARDLDDIRLEAHTLTHLGQIAYSQGRLSKAIDYLDTSISLQEANNFSLGLVQSHLGKAETHLAMGEAEKASGALQDAASIAKRMRNQLQIANCLEIWAQSHWEVGEHLQASVRWFAATAAWREQKDAPRFPARQAQYETYLSQMKTYFSADHFARLWSQGKTLLLEEALAQALGQPAAA